MIFAVVIEALLDGVAHPPQEASTSSLDGRCSAWASRPKKSFRFSRESYLHESSVNRINCVDGERGGDAANESFLVPPYIL